MLCFEAFALSAQAELAGPMASRSKAKMKTVKEHMVFRHVREFVLTDICDVGVTTHGKTD